MPVSTPLCRHGNRLYSAAPTLIEHARTAQDSTIFEGNQGMRYLAKGVLRRVTIFTAAGLKPSLALAMTTTLLTVLLAAATTSAQEHRIQLEDLTKIVTVSDPQISPGGKSIVCVVSRQNFDEDRSDRELVLVDVATGAQRVLTFDRKGVGSPRWSPTGDGLAFVAVVPYTQDKNNKRHPKREDDRRFSSCR